jgi:hypothetical protein
MTSELQEQPVSIPVGGSVVSGLLVTPPEARHVYVVAHGAGAGMRHPFLHSVAHCLAPLGIATLRYQFPYMEQHKRRPDVPAVAHAAVRAAVAAAAEQLPGVAIVAGGKSFGGRMTSQAQAEAPLDGVRGLVFLGFPLHAPGKPSVTRGEHLEKVGIPMLFLQGTRDDFARLDLITEVTARLDGRARLELVDGADHSFHVKKSTSRNDGGVLEDLCTSLAEWVDRTT